MVPYGSFPFMSYFPSIASASAVMATQAASAAASASAKVMRFGGFGFTFGCQALARVTVRYG